MKGLKENTIERVKSEFVMRRDSFNCPKFKFMRAEAAWVHCLLVTCMTANQCEGRDDLPFSSTFCTYSFSFVLVS